MPLHAYFFYLTIILLPTQLGLHVWPDWAFVVGRRVDYLSPTLFLTDITIILTLFFWSISLFKNFHLKKKFHVSFKHHWSAIWRILILMLFIVVNIFFATSLPVALSKWCKVLEFGLFGLYMVKTKNHVRTIVTVLSIPILYSSLIGLAQFFFQHSLGGIYWFLGERTFDITTPGIARIQIFPFFIIHSSELLRPYATFPHPNVLGGFLAITLPLLINQLSNNPILKLSNKKLKIFLWITVALGGITLLFTFSRSALIAGAIGLLLSQYIMKKKQLLNYWYYWIIGLLVLFIFALPYFQTLTKDSESVYVRHELNIAAIQMITPQSISFIKNAQHIFFGVGLGNYLVELPKYYPHRTIFFLQPVHNIYLLLLSEIGILGFGIVFYLLFKLFKTPLHKHQFSIMHYALCIMLLIGLVDHYALTTQQGQLLLTLFLALNIYEDNARSLS